MPQFYLMKHHFYMMRSADPAPLGDGDTRSWFFYYKFYPGSDDWFLVPCKNHIDAQEGDRLWFVLDDEVIGVTTIRRVEIYPLTGVQELWYMGQGLFSIQRNIRVSPSQLQEDQELAERMYISVMGQNQNR